ncbi:MAG: tetratricopeptide repeat protein [Phycisphaerales bacterium]|nr:tetratricopeptide repeat protein [Phycisphaerales bacterium]
MLHFDFVNYDDDEVVIENTHVHGMSTENLTWMFTGSRAGHYHPLTWLSLALDYQFYGGLRPMGFHLTNLLLHIATAVGVFLVSRELIRRSAAGSNAQPPAAIAEPSATAEPATTWGALVAALLFAVHPLRVESVAWVTERRDVLSGAFLLLTAYFYISGAERSSKSAYRTRMVVAWMMFLFSLLSKAWGITLPAMLLILDVFPLRRIRRGPDGRILMDRRVWIEKFVFAVPALAAGVAAILAQRASGALQPLDSYTPWMRFLQAIYALGFYLAKTLWPVDLVPFYGWPEDMTEVYAPTLLCAIALGAAAIVIWRSRRRCPAVALAAAVYVVLVSPVLGIAQSGPQLVADRYTYLCIIPLTILIGGGITRLLTQARRRTLGMAACAAALAVTALLVGMTRRQVLIWQDGPTLWAHHVALRPDCPIGHVNYGSALFDEAAAVEDGNDPLRTELLEQAFSHYVRASELRRSYLIAVRGAGRCLMAMRRREEAFAWFQRALELHDDDPVTFIDLADSLAAQGRLDEALTWYRRAADTSGKEAFEARYEAGRRLHEARRCAEAAAEFEQALRIKPSDTTCHQALAESRIALNQDAGALESLEAAHRFDPESVAVRARLAFMLASTDQDALRDPPRALTLAQQAFDQSRAKGVDVYEALAAAHAAVGNVDRAAALLEEILARAPQGASLSWIERLEKQRAQYLKGEPLRE